MRARDLVALAAAGVAIAVAGCGSSNFSKQSPGDILKDAVSAVNGASSYVLSESGDQDAKPISTELLYAGPTTVGLTVGTATGEFAIILSGGHNYLKADATYWTNRDGARVATAYANRWFTITSAQSGLSSGEVAAAAPKQLAQCLSSDILDPHVTTTGTINGESAVELTYTSASGAPSDAWIAQSSPHYLLRIHNSDHSTTAGISGLCDYHGKGTIVFTDWDSAPPVTAPVGAPRLP